MYNKTVRINAIEVTVNSDLTISYRLTLPIKEEHVHLFEDRDRIKSYVKNNKIRYHYEYTSNNRESVLRHMMVAQVVITNQKITELKNRRNLLLFNLSNQTK